MLVMDDERGTGIPVLLPTDLYTTRQSRDAARLKAYNQILGQIYHRIKTVSKMPGNGCHILYTIPQFIIGLPRIDLEDCVVYLVYQLRTVGYVVRYTYPSLIYISWNHHEKEYLTNQNPIFKAMMTAKNAEVATSIGISTPKKAATGDKQKKKVGATAVTTKKAVSWLNSPPVMIRPSAEDYIPPASFMAGL